MSDNLSVTPGAGTTKVATVEATHSGETVHFPIHVAAGAKERTPAYAEIAFGSIGSSFSTALGAPSANKPYLAIYGVNDTDQDLYLSSGSNTNPEFPIPAFANFYYSFVELGIFESDAITVKHQGIAPAIGKLKIGGVTYP